MYITKDTVTNTLQRCVFPAFEPTYLSQKGFSSEMRVVCGVVFRQELKISFFSPHSVVLACLCTCHVTNKTFGLIWDCWVFLTSINTKPPGPEDQHLNGMLQSAAPKTPPGYSPGGTGLFWWEATEAGEPMTRLVFQFISTLWKAWAPVSLVQSTDTKWKFTSAAKRVKGYLEDTEVGICGKHGGGSQ